MSIINFGLIGVSGCGLFFVRIAKISPERFKCVGVFLRNVEKREVLKKMRRTNLYFNNG